MINFVLIHIGRSFPEYMIDSINQIIRFNNNPIYVLMNTEALNNFHIDNSLINIINIDNFYISDKLIQFDVLSYLSEFGNENFWNVTCKRLFILEEFMRLYNIKNVIHLENDIAVYTDFSKLENIFGIFFNNKLAINPVGPKHDAAACIYVHDYTIIKEVNDLILFCLKQDRNVLVEKIGESFISEMILLKFIADTSNTIDYLPLAPDNNLSKYLTDFNSCFDCASWGQFIGGTPQGHPPGSGFSNHWLGNDLNNKKYSIVWKIDDLNRKIPYIEYNSDLYKLNNLHIHCKRVKDFI